MKQPTPQEITTLREKTGWSQRRTAKELGVHFNTVNNWEKARTAMPAASWELFKIKVAR